jgi:hypothetical protein
MKVPACSLVSRAQIHGHVKVVADVGQSKDRAC